MVSISKLLLLLSFGLMELHLLFRGYDEKVNMFVSSTAKDTQQTIGWYVYDNAQMLCWILVLLAILLAKDKHGIRKIIIIHITYRIFDIAMYWWDFRQSNTAYIIAYSIITTVILLDVKKWKWQL